MELISKPEEDASLTNTWANQMRIIENDSPAVERPLQENEVINWVYCIGTEYWSAREPDLEDPIWRKEAKEEMLKRIEEVHAWNTLYASTSRPRKISPSWLYIIRKIDAAEADLERHGKVLDTGLYEWSESDIDSTDASEDEGEEESNELNKAAVELPSIIYIEETASEYSEDDQTDASIPDENDNSDGPTDCLQVIPENARNESVNTSGSTNATSSDDDRARADPAPSPNRPTQRNDASIRYNKASQHVMRFGGRYWNWRRPCLKGLHTLVLGDSSIRIG